MKHSITKTQVVKTIAFLLVFVLLFIGITNILQPKWIDGTSVTFVQKEMYEQPRNSVDVLVIGSSQLVYGVSSMRLLEEHGISAYSCATGEQPVLCGYFYLKEALTKQDIKAVIYDVSMLYEDEQEARFRKTLDMAPLSMNKLWLINERHGAEGADSRWTYLFPIMKYHSRWDELTEQDFHYMDMNTEVFKGNIMSPEVSSKIKYDVLCVDNEEEDPSIVMDESELEAFREMVDFCEEQEIPLILVKTPKQSWTKSAMLGAKALAEEYNLPYMDFNTGELMDAIGLDITKDFWNGDHLNIRGAEKLTDYLAGYLKANFEFEDGRKTDAYDEQEVAKYYVDRENKYLMTSYDINELLGYMDNERYEILMQATGNIGDYWNEDYQTLVEAFGVTKNLKEVKDQTFVGHYRNGSALYEEMAAEEMNYEANFEDGEKLTVKSKLNISDAENMVELAGETVAYNKAGLNVSVYDWQNSKVVDNFTLYVDGESGTLKVYRNR